MYVLQFASKTEEDVPDSRKTIRQVMTGRKLQDETKRAAKAEKERRDRVTELRKKVNLMKLGSFDY